MFLMYFECDVVHSKAHTRHGALDPNFGSSLVMSHYLVSGESSVARMAHTVVGHLGCSTGSAQEVRTNRYLVGCFHSRTEGAASWFRISQYSLSSSQEVRKNA